MIGIKAPAYTIVSTQIFYRYASTKTHNFYFPTNPLFLPHYLQRICRWREMTCLHRPDRVFDLECKHKNNMAAKINFKFWANNYLQKQEPSSDIIIGLVS